MLTHANSVVPAYRARTRVEQSLSQHRVTLHTRAALASSPLSRSRFLLRARCEIGRNAGMGSGVIAVAIWSTDCTRDAPSVVAVGVCCTVAHCSRSAR